MDIPSTPAKQGPRPVKHTQWEPWFEQELKGLSPWEITYRSYTLFDKIKGFVTPSLQQDLLVAIRDHLKGE